MNLGMMTNRVRRQLPSATVESVSDQSIWDELNLGVDECNRYTQVYKGYTEFSSVANQQIYALSTYVPKYLGITKGGCWYLVGTSLKELFPKTIRWMDLNIRNWRDLSAAEPQWYWAEGDDLGLYPKPSTASTLRIYHLKKSIPMDNANNYPWENTTTEITALQAMDNAIIAHAKWKLSTAVGKEQDTFYAEFIREIQKAQTQIRRRPDIASHWDNFIRIDGQTHT